MRDSARTLSTDGHLGLRGENTIDALKSQLGVDRLELVVMSDVNEYRELLVEKVPPRWSLRKKILLAAAVLVLLAVFSGIAHPGARLDRLVHHLSVEVH